MNRCFLFSIATFLLVFCLFACSATEGRPEQSEKADAVADGDTQPGDADNGANKVGRSSDIRAEGLPTPVRVMKLEKHEVVSSVSVNGSVASNHDVSVLSETAGRVVQDNMVLGKSFRSGEILLSVDPEPYQIQVQTAEGNFETANAAAGNAEREFNRMKTLHESGDVTDSQFDQVRTAYENAQAAVKIAEAGLKQARRALRLSSVRAPFNGIVAARLAKLGDTIAQGSLVAQLVDSDSIKIEVGVGEDYIGWLEVGHKALVRFPTLKIDAIPASVSAFGVKALQPTMTYPVELELESRPPELRVGMIARVDMEIGEKINALTVPLEVLIDRFDKKYLFVVKDGVAHERQVALGLEVGRDVVVTSGVDDGEIVVVYGQANLKDGANVTVVE